MIIQLQRALLRPWQNGDQHSLIHHANNFNVWINVRDTFPHPYTIMDAERWILHAQSLRDTQFAIVIENNAVGGIGIIPQTDVYKKSMEIGYWLGEEFWGRGIVSEAVSAVKEYAFTSFDIVRIFADVFDWNPASARVLEKNGFVFEGKKRSAVIKNGKLGDLLMYAIVKQ
jgi:RimJ/RimL family protein N-acetyltransferase